MVPWTRGHSFRTRRSAVTRPSTHDPSSTSGPYAAGCGLAPSTMLPAGGVPMPTRILPILGTPDRVLGPSDLVSFPDQYHAVASRAQIFLRGRRDVPNLVLRSIRALFIAHASHGRPNIEGADRAGVFLRATHTSRISPAAGAPRAGIAHRTDRLRARISACEHSSSRPRTTFVTVAHWTSSPRR